MSGTPLDLNPPEMESLFAAEREIEPEAVEFRDRVFARARASVPRYVRPRLGTTPAGRVSVGAAAAAAVVLIALCAAAFEVGYRLRSQVPTASVTGSAAPSVAEVTVDVEPMAPPAAALVPVPADPRSASVVPRTMKAKPAGRAKPATLSEAYALELPVLQPALDAVANQDYLAALAAIAAHQRKFPSGHLAEEREGLRVKALVGLGHMSEAARAGTTFCERFPHSALLGQIQEMLGTQQ